MCDELENEAAEVVVLTPPSDPARRGFFTLVAGGLAALATLRARRAEARKVGLALAKTPALQKVGGSALLKIKDQKVLLIRDGEASVRAINPVCTHKNCTVKFSTDSGKMHCPCHKSAFALDGTVLDGPAPKPLATFPATLSGEQIVLSLPD